MKKPKLDTNLVGRLVRFADKNELMPAAFADKQSEEILGRRFTVGESIPAVKNDPNWPDEQDGEIVAVLPYADGSGFELMVVMPEDGRTRKVGQYLLECGVVTIGPPVPDRDPALGDIAIHLSEIASELVRITDLFDPSSASSEHAHVTTDSR